MECDVALHEDLMYKLSIWTSSKRSTFSISVEMSKDVQIKSSYPWYHVSAVNAKICLLWNNFPV